MTTRKTPANAKETEKLAFSLLVKKDAARVFDAVNDVGAWWNADLNGETRGLDSEFTVQFGEDHYSRQRIVEWVPGKRVVWLVTESKLSWLSDPTEWKGTKVVFELSTEGSSTKLHFTHLGLAPGVECFDGCNEAWRHFVGGSLRSLIEDGVGEPHKNA